MVYKLGKFMLFISVMYMIDIEKSSIRVGLRSALRMVKVNSKMLLSLFVFNVDNFLTPVLKHNVHPCHQM